VVQYELQQSLKFGKALYITGSIQELGNWGANPRRLTWQKQDYWTCEVNISTKRRDFSFEYKFMISDYDININSHREYEPGPNRIFRKKLQKYKTFKSIK